jgi:rhodanese-related sulfurtransferase
MSMLEDLAPETVRKSLADHGIVLIDVREPAEFAAERIEGALLFPLSSFDPAALPDPGIRKLVFQCGSGKRSAMAVERSVAAGLPYTAHLAGGLMAWKAAGLPTLRAES